MGAWISLPGSPPASANGTSARAVASAVIVDLRGEDLLGVRIVLGCAGEWGSSAFQGANLIAKGGDFPMQGGDGFRTGQLCFLVLSVTADEEGR